MKKKKLKALNNYLFLENIKLSRELEHLKKSVIYIVTKKENILFGKEDQRTIYYLPRKVNDKLDFKVFSSYNDAYDYIRGRKEKLTIITSEIT